MTCLKLKIKRHVLSVSVLDSAAPAVEAAYQGVATLHSHMAKLIDGNFKPKACICPRVPVHLGLADSFRRYVIPSGAYVLEDFQQ